MEKEGSRVKVGKGSLSASRGRGARWLRRFDAACESEQQIESIDELISQAKEAVCTRERKVPEAPYEGNVLLYGANF
ncbi:unnamed protein product [Sphagnum balticum]